MEGKNMDKTDRLTAFGVIDRYLYEEEVPWPSNHAQRIIERLEAAGYKVVDTETLRTALNFGYGKEPTPEGAIARANLREELTTSSGRAGG
jgi:hypothetical protein